MTFRGFKRFFFLAFHVILVYWERIYRAPDHCSTSASDLVLFCIDVITIYTLLHWNTFSISDYCSKSFCHDRAYVIICNLLWSSFMMGDRLFQNFQLGIETCLFCFLISILKVSTTVLAGTKHEHKQRIDTQARRLIFLALVSLLFKIIALVQELFLSLSLLYGVKTALISSTCIFHTLFWFCSVFK